MICFRKTALGAAFVIFAAAISSTTQAATFTSLYSFPDNSTATNPAGGLFRDASGALYGTTLGGGITETPCPDSGCGVVFQLIPPTATRPNWTRKILHKFAAEQLYDVYSSLVADADGNLYGAGYSGGANGGGAVFQLMKPPAGSSTWTFKVIYQMTTARGTAPFCDLLIDSRGRIYLTSYEGGANEAGTVLRLRPPVAGEENWSSTVLHTFNEPDGMGPSSGVVAGPDGSLYGTTYGGGANNAGVIYRLTPPASGGGAWTFRKLHDFAGGARGAAPQGTLVLLNGFLYGTTYLGGTTTIACPAGCGTIFRMKLPSDPAGAVSLAVLHKMREAIDGSNPWTGLTFGPGNALYGTNYLQGPGGQGTLFRLRPPANGNPAVFTRLHAFSGGAGGDDPTATLLRGSDGKLYGATQYGGTGNVGMIFSYDP